MDAKAVLDLAKKNHVVMVDLRFTDWPGMWQHFSVPISELDEKAMQEGFGFDGSSIRGWDGHYGPSMTMKKPQRPWAWTPQT